jgi:hypothetical protein
MPSTQDPHGSSPIDGVGDPRKGAIESFSPSKWVLDAAAARALIGLGATVFQVRGSGPKAARSIQNAAPVSWQHFSHEDVPINPRTADTRMPPHVGPGHSADNTGDALDYFGAIVNIAARLEHQCRGGEVIVSEAVAKDAETEAALADRMQLEETATLRGVGAPVQLVRVKGLRSARLPVV